MQSFFPNPFWSALTTEQASFAIGSGLALRYPPDVLPFAALQNSSPESFSALRDLLTPGEIVYLTGDDLPSLAAYGIAHEASLPGWQMHPTAPITPQAPSIAIRELTPEDAPAMVALTEIAFPGFFRARTYQLGRYFGIHIQGDLVAMAGERVALPGYRELSAICTHPAHTGKGYAAALIARLLQAQAAAGHRSFLHVVQSNHRAIALYERVGFLKTVPIVFHRLRRL